MGRFVESERFGADVAAAGAGAFVSLILCVILTSDTLFHYLMVLLILSDSL